MTGWGHPTRPMLDPFTVRVERARAGQLELDDAECVGIGAFDGRQGRAGPPRSAP